MLIKISHYTTKIISLIRFIFYKPFFYDSGYPNYIYKNTMIRGKSFIKIGNKNNFYPYSSLIIDPFKNLKNQKIIIGNNVIFSPLSILKSHGGIISIGNNVFIGERVQIQGLGGVVISDNVMVAAGTFISSSNHDISQPLSDSFLKTEIPKATFIGSNVWIGANCIILPGITIGEKSIIAAGSVVTKDVKPYTLVAGNPCNTIKIFCTKAKKWIRV